MPNMKGKYLKKLTGVEDCDFCRQHVGVDEVYEKGEKQIRLGKQQRNKADDVGTYVIWSTHSYEKYCSRRFDYTIQFVYSKYKGYTTDNWPS